MTVTINEAATIFKLLGDKTRVTIMKLLEEDECCVCELVEVFQMSQPSISQHLRKLRDNDLIREKRKGQWIFYSLNKNGEAYPLIKHVLEVLPSQKEKLAELAAKGGRIQCC